MHGHILSGLAILVLHKQFQSVHGNVLTTSIFISGCLSRTHQFYINFHGLLSFRIGIKIKS